jgi:hypothetical protein
MRHALLTLTALAFVSAPAQAQDATSRPIQPTEQFQMTGGSGVGAAWGGVQIGGYGGTLLSDPTNPSITLYCVDFVHSIGVGNVVNANTMNVGNNNADLSLTRLAYDPNLAPAGAVDSRLMQYRQSAFLASLFSSYTDFASVAFDSDGDGSTDTTFGTYGSGNVMKNAWSGIHAAIWSIMTPGFPASPANHSGYITDVDLAMAMAAPFMTLAQNAANAGFGGLDLSEWSVLSDQNADGQIGGKQEFLVRTNTVPEPATVVLMFTGLLVLFGVHRRRQAAMGDD